jgi:hypothetical protein
VAKASRSVSQSGRGNSCGGEAGARGGRGAPARRGDHAVRTRRAWSGFQREAEAEATTLLLLGEDADVTGSW